MRKFTRRYVRHPIGVSLTVDMLLHLDENLSMQLYAVQSYIRQQINVLHALI